MIRIIDTDYTKIDVELISIIENNNKKYLIYSKGEKQKTGNLIIYISKLIIKEGQYVLKNIRNEEWNDIRKLLRNIVSK